MEKYADGEDGRTDMASRSEIGEDELLRCGPHVLRQDRKILEGQR
jgi:hypothetical protein